MLLCVYCILLLFWFVCSFIALLDYVNRAHEIEICPLSVRPSVRPSVSQLSLNLTISFKFWLLLPLGHTQRQFYYFVKKKYFDFFFTNIFR